MKLSLLKTWLKSQEEVSFLLPDGTEVPKHFHVTEVGIIDKHFIDCGGQMRQEKTVNFQLWTADDHDHRLGAKKLLDIIALSERQLGIEDHEIEVEYQSDTIGKYGLDIKGDKLHLLTKQTDCLAKDQCGIPTEKVKLSLSELTVQKGNCTPGGGCC